jgi:hypothetical protein
VPSDGATRRHARLADRFLTPAAFARATKLLGFSRGWTFDRTYPPIMGATPLLSTTQIYLVQDDRPLSLEIVIGDEQAGGTSLIWNGAIIDIPPAHQPFRLAENGGTTRAKTLHCSTRVRDVNPNTNHTCVTYVLRGGMQDREFTYELTVPTEHAFADYVVDFVFI